MNEIVSILDAINARYLHISATSSFCYDEASKAQQAFYNAQLTILRDVVREVKQARGCYEPAASAAACFIMRQAKATT